MNYALENSFLRKPSAAFGTYPEAKGAIMSKTHIVPEGTMNEVQETDAQRYERMELEALREQQAAVAALQPAATTQLSPEALAIVNGSLNKSSKIRALLALGLTRGVVAKTLNIRYQHVRNVEITPLKRVPIASTPTTQVANNESAAVAA